MSPFVAALPMYDWPEARAEIDAEWAVIRDRLRAAGVEAPERLARRNGDLPPVPGGIRDRSGNVIAPDPATLPPDGLDLRTLWLHPALLYSQTCWGPMETAELAAHVAVVGQPDYSGFEGGSGVYYSSAIVMRADERRDRTQTGLQVPARTPGLPLDLLRGKRLAFNTHDSMSGFLALARDLDAAGESVAIFAGTVETGSHRASGLAVAEGRAAVAAMDCRSWSLFRRFEPEAERLIPVGWTAPRKGLPFIRAAGLPAEAARAVDALYSVPAR